MGKVDNSNGRVLIVMGSDSDWPQVAEAVTVLNEFGVRRNVAGYPQERL